MERQIPKVLALALSSVLMLSIKETAKGATSAPYYRIAGGGEAR
jgi:hypothetical protein